MLLGSVISEAPADNPVLGGFCWQKGSKRRESCLGSKLDGINLMSCRSESWAGSGSLADLLVGRSDRLTRRKRESASARTTIEGRPDCGDDGNSPALVTHLHRDPRQIICKTSQKLHNGKYFNAPAACGPFHVSARNGILQITNDRLELVSIGHMIS